MLINLLLPFLLLFNINTKTAIDIHEAVFQNKIKLEVVSKGGHSGNCIMLKITPLEKLKFPISIPAGTHFIANDDPNQNILVVTEQQLALKGKEEQTFEVEGYCSQYRDYSPEENATFRMEMTKNTNLQSLADYMNAHNYNQDVKQSSVWAVSDGNDVSSIYDYSRNEDTKNLRKFICKMMKN